MSKEKVKLYRFFYHFNKPMTQKTGEVHWTVHFRDKCHQVKNILCKVQSNTKANKDQPRGVVQGYCTEVIIDKESATIQ